MIKRLLALALCAAMLSSCFLAGCTNAVTDPADTTGTTADSGGTTAPDTTETDTETTSPGTEPMPEDTTPPSTDNGNNGGEDTPNDDPIVFVEYDLERIAYQQTGLTQKTNEALVAMDLTSGPSSLTGIEVSVKVYPRVELPSDGRTFYVIVDWGDGTWNYYGPNLVNEEILYHAYKTSGEYAVKACLVNLSGGTLFGWTAPKTVTVTGDDWDGTMINTLSPFASSVSEGKAEDILDGDVSTYVKTKKATSNDAEEYVGLYFDDVYRLDRLEIQFPTGQECFPSNIALEYTTDGGVTWYSLPKYYYLFDYSEGRYRPVMDFPDPTGATLVFDMDGIVANGVRFTSKRFSVQGKTFAVSEMRAYGDKELLFYTNMGATYNADLNNMWTIFGTAATEPGTEYYSMSSGSPFRTGMALIMSTEWFEWNGLKFNWTDVTNAQNANVSSLINARYGPDGWSDDEGYIWATDNHPEHLGGQRHYSLNPIYILAVRNCLLQGNYKTVWVNGVETPLLEAQNGLGQSIRNKIDKAMSYMLNTLDGKTGILTIYDPENDGTQNGNASNYWDTHRAFGYKSAYENALFYGSLVAMADIEAYCGNMEQAAYYLQLAAKTKEEYNKLFWDEEKGRYITSVNIRGERLDFGMTMVNFYAATYGLASEEQAQLIYDWLDGKRIIEGDTSQGEDIYGEFIYASRVNTLDMSSTGAPYYWWDHNGIMPCTPNTLGGYGNQMQNGGTIFYISYYDMIGRLNTLGADSAYSRFSVIMEEFHKDSLRRNRYSAYGEYCEGVIGEFPESGLVPLTYLTGFMGITPGSTGLCISPNLPSEYDVAGVREYHFNGNVYSIEIDRNATSSSMEFDGEKYVVTVSADSDYVITFDNELVKVA